MLEEKCEELKRQLMKQIPAGWNRILIRVEKSEGSSTYAYLCETDEGTMERFNYMRKVFPEYSVFEIGDLTKPCSFALDEVLEALKDQNIHVLYYTLDKTGKYELEYKDEYDFVGDEKDRFALWEYQYMDIDQIYEKERIYKYFTEEQIAQRIKDLTDIEQKRKEYEQREKMRTRGRDMIYEAMDNLYHQESIDRLAPAHYWKATGKDPLEVVEMYDAGEYWHFVSLGLSELYEKISDDPTVSGFGMEFTFKLKKTEGIDFELEKEAVYNNMQQLATESYINGVVFQAYEYVYTGQKEGIDYNRKSQLVGFIIVPDKSLAPIVTPNGKVEFLVLIGVKQAEIDKLVNKELTVKELYEQLGTDLTDLNR